IATVMETPGDLRQVLEPRGDVMGALLEDLSAFVLGEFPPCLGFRDWNQRRPCRFRASERLLTRRQLTLLLATDISLIARNPAENPTGIDSTRGTGPFEDFNMRNRRERFPRDRLQPLNPPPPCPGTDERDAQREHGLSLQHSNNRAARRGRSG